MKPKGFTTNIKTKFFLIGFIGLNILVFQTSMYSQVNKNEKKEPIPKVVSFGPESNQYQDLFEGEKDSVAFYSGVVTLEPNQSGELHSTEKYEEMIITLEGEGQIKIKKQKDIEIKFGKIALIPANTEHQLVNIGKKNFKYIYVATKQK